jgi:hypothetical protein
MAPKKCHGLLLCHALAVGATTKADVSALGLVLSCTSVNAESRLGRCGVYGRTSALVVRQIWPSKIMRVVEITTTWKLCWRSKDSRIAGFGGEMVGEG